MDRVEHLRTAVPLFEEVDDEEENLIDSQYPIFNPGRGRPSPMTDTRMNFDQAIGVVENGGGSREARDESFEITLRQLRQELNDYVSRAVFDHPWYAFVQAVNGAMGIAIADATLGFNTSAATADIEFIITSLRRVHVLQKQEKTTQYSAEDIETRAREYDKLLQEARSDLERWDRQITPLSALVLRFWDTTERDVESAYNYSQGMRLLFEANLMDDLLGGTNILGEEKMQRLDDALNALGVSEGEQTNALFWNTARNELYPLLIGRWNIQELYDFDGSQGFDDPVLFRLADEWIRETMFPQRRKPASAPQPPNTLQRNVVDILDYTTVEEIEEGSAEVDTQTRYGGVGQTATEPDFPLVREAMNNLNLAWNDQSTGFETSVFATRTQREVYALVYVPVALALDILDRLLRDPFAQTTIESLEILRSVQTRIGSSIQDLEIPPASPYSARRVADKLQELQDLLIDSDILEDLRVDALRARPRDIVLYIRKVILDNGNAGVLAETQNGGDFWTYVDDHREQTNRLFSVWRKRVRSLNVTPESDETLELVAAVIVATFLYQDFFSQRRLQLSRSIDQIREVRGQQQRRRRDLLRLPQQVSLREAEIDRIKKVAQEAQERLLEGENTGPQNDIVQAANWSFLLVKQSVRAFAQLKYAENIVLSDNENIVTAFATLVAAVRRKYQINGPAVGYVQNAHFARMKVELNGAIQMLARFEPRGRLGGDRSGYRFTER